MRPLQTATPVEQAPALPQAGVTVVVPGQAPQALTSRDIASLRERRSELSRQLSSAEDRRSRLAESLKGTDGADRQGIVQRIEVLDKRIVQIEQDIAQTGREITSAPLGLTTSTEPATRLMGLEEENFVALAGAFTVFVLFPLALAFARMMWKRAATRPPEKDVESERRMERMEQALDSIAIEIERVSENQRFATRILSEGNALPALPAGQAPAEPIRMPVRETVRNSREST